MNLHDPNQRQHVGQPLDGARGALILLHGRGSSAEDILGLANALPRDGLAFLAPSARHNTWYPQRFLFPTEQNEPWLSSALDVIATLIAEAQAAGLARERIGLIGFSQGGCLALEAAARRPGRYGLVAGLSGGLIGPLETTRPAANFKGTPVLLGCAAQDAHIPLEYVERSAAYFEASEATVTKQIYPGSAHTVFAPEIAWLTEQLQSWQ